MKKRFMALCTAIFMFAALSISVSSQSIPQFTADNPDYLVEETMTRGSKAPTSATTLPYYAKITDLAASKGTYTNYYFTTSSGTLKITGDLQSRGTGNIKARAYQIDLYNTSSTAVYDSYSGEFSESGTVSCTFRNLDKSKNWYIKFRNISDSAASTSKDISGNLTIDD